MNEDTDGEYIDNYIAGKCFFYVRPINNISH